MNGKTRSRKQLVPRGGLSERLKAEKSFGLRKVQPIQPIQPIIVQRGSRMNGCKVPGEYLSPTDMQRKSHAMHHPILDGGRADQNQNQNQNFHSYSHSHSHHSLVPIALSIYHLSVFYFYVFHIASTGHIPFPNTIKATVLRIET